MRRSILERNLFHLIAGSLLPLIGLLVPRDIIFWTSVSVAGLAIGVELARFTFGRVNDYVFTHIGVLFKEGERRAVSGATYMLIGTVGAFLFFDKSLAIMALLFLSLGDPAAAIVGTRYGRHRIFSKSLEGSAAFLSVSLIVAGLFALSGAISPVWPMLVGASVAALVELLPLPIDDNLTVPMFAGVVTAALL